MSNPSKKQKCAIAAYVFFGLALLVELVELIELLAGCVTSSASGELAFVAVFLFLSPVVVAISLAPLLVVSLIFAITASRDSSRTQFPAIEQCKIATLVRGISFGVTVNLFSLVATCAIIFAVAEPWLDGVLVFSALSFAAIISIVITIFVRPLIQLRRISSATSAPLRVPKLKTARIWAYIWLVSAILSLPYSFTLISGWLGVFFR